MLYTGTGGKGDEVFNCLKEDGQRFIYEMLSCLCKYDKKACPYQVKDFEINFISRDNLNNLLEIRAVGIKALKEALGSAKMV